MRRDGLLPVSYTHLDVYKRQGAICRCWNWRDGERTALTDDSKKAFLIIESVDPAHADDLAAATDQLAAMVEHHLGATIFAKQIITRDNPTMVIDE